MEAVKAWVLRYRSAALILCVGLVLMLLPAGKGEKAPPREETPAQPELSRQLEQILSAVEGAGKVRVLLTEKTGGEIHYQTDLRSDSDEVRSSEQEDTVLVDGENRMRTGLVRRRDPPRYLGAIVVCQGAGSARVRLEITRAVQCAAGLRTDQIQVIPMK